MTDFLKKNYQLLITVIGFLILGIVILVWQDRDEAWSGIEEVRELTYQNCRRLDRVEVAFDYIKKELNEIKQELKK